MLQGSQACRAGLGTFTSCPTCGQRFHGVYQKYNLKRHMSIHTGERPYPCPRCPAAFNQKCNMKRHLESVHGEQAGGGQAAAGAAGAAGPTRGT